MSELLFGVAQGKKLRPSKSQPDHETAGETPFGCAPFLRQGKQDEPFENSQDKPTLQIRRNGSVARRWRGRRENLADGVFERLARLFADEVNENTALARVEKCFGHRAGPNGIHALIEGVHVDAHLLAIVREVGTMLREKVADQMHVGIVVEADAKRVEAFRRVFLAEIDEPGKLLATGFAPGSPESDHERLAFVFREDAIVAIEVNQLGISGSGRLGGLRRGVLISRL